MKKVEKISNGKNYIAATVGKWSELSQHVVTLAPGIEIPGKAFLGETTQSTGTEISFTITPVGKGGDFLHTHKTNEETYIVLQGNGQFQVDAKVFDIAEGSVIRITPDGKRAYRNTGNEPLIIICIQSQSHTLNDLGITDGVILEETVQW